MLINAGIVAVEAVIDHPPHGERQGQRRAAAAMSANDGAGELRAL